MVYIYYVAILGTELITAIADLLNLKQAKSASVPEEFSDLLDEKQYVKSQEYLNAQTKFSLFRSALSTILLLLAIYFGWFGALSDWTGIYTEDSLLHALLFFASIAIISEIISLPFSYFHTFILEERFGFNRSTLKTFITDHAKGWALGIILGAPITYALLWFFERGGTFAWMWSWLAFSLIQIILLFLAPVVFMPLFYRFNPLAEGELKNKIMDYAKAQKFQIQGVYTMDGSKRSSKANAFFTGFGPFRRIVLFDTLIEKHNVDELLAVLAHEVGHFKLRHIQKQIFLSFVISFFLFYLLGIVIESDDFILALGFNNWSLHAGILAAFLLYAPLSLSLGMISSLMSRTFEFEADAFAVKTTGSSAHLIEALKKLSKDNLSNLNPHSWKVWLEYSHPPIVSRLKALAKQ